jgi:hypothetical protein
MAESMAVVYAILVLAALEHVALALSRTASMAAAEVHCGRYGPNIMNLGTGLFYGPFLICLCASLVIWIRTAQEVFHSRCSFGWVIYGNCATFGAVQATYCFWLSQWMRRLLKDASSTAPQCCIEMLKTVRYSAEDKQAELTEGCPICLAEWEEGDEIKLTNCQHAFHSDCLAAWLVANRTCAICRQDVSKGIHPPGQKWLADLSLFV